MINNFFKETKKAFFKLDDKILKILKYGLKFSFIILVISLFILAINLIFVHNVILYQFGLLVFEISLYFSADFVISALAIDIISKQLI